MRYVPFGSGAVRLSCIGIGGWQAGGPGPWGAGPASDDELALAAIRRAIEGGMNWVDTAASYGLGHSEELVAKALSPWRIGEEVFVFTKCGHPWRPPDLIRTDLRPASIRLECEGTLRRLGLERIDLYQFHHADPATPIEESWAVMARLVDEGKIRWAGVSNFTVELLNRCETIRHVDCVQLELNLLRREAMFDVLPWCGSHGSDTIVYSPMASGLLGARDGRDRLIESSSPDSRRGHSKEAVAGLLDDLQLVAARLGTTVAVLAVAWVVHVAGVTGAICGARSPEQVDGRLPAGDLELNAVTLREIDDALARRAIS